jgi:plasmid stabilization system protein ParE
VASGPSSSTACAASADAPSSSWSRATAPGALRIELEQALALLVEHPHAGMRVRTPRPGEVRRFLLLRTQYFLYYRVREQQLEVLALWHASRGAGPSV